MPKIFNSKKGVSPLIATILLIAFAVALGSVVMNWGLNLDLGKPTDRCRNVQIKIRNIDNAEACYGIHENNGYINFIIDNIGSIDVHGLAIWVIGEKGTSFFEIDPILIKKGELFEKGDKNLVYDFAKFGSIKQVQFIPKTRTQQTMDICSRKAVKAEEIGICSNKP